MKRTDALLKTAKYLVAGASSIALFATAFTTSALAEAKDSADALNASPLVKLVQKSTSGLAQKGADAIQKVVDTAAQDAEQLINTAGNETLNSAGEDVSSTEDNSVNQLETPSSLDSSQGESLTADATANDDAIVISDDGTTVIIQGDTTASDIHTAMQSADPNLATTVLFKNQIVITTDQGSTSPFENFSWLKKVLSEDGAKVSYAAATGANAPTLREFFYSCHRLESIDGLSAWDVSNVSGDSCMRKVFSGCSDLTSLDALAAWDVSSVASDSCMQEMFSGCSDLTSLDALAAWDVSNVTGFFACSQCLTTVQALFR